MERMVRLSLRSRGGENKISSAVKILIMPDKSPFKIEPDRVLAGSRRVPGADPDSFKVLLAGWAKDKAQVYCNAGIVTGADPQSFEALNVLFARDARAVYYVGRVMKGVDPRCFEVLDTGEYKSFWGNSVFQGYARDKQSVFYFSYDDTKPSVVRGADPLTFEVLKSVYARDSKSAYYAGRPIKKADRDTFKVVEFNYACDRQHAFYCERLIVGAEVDMFEVVDMNRSRAHDSKRLYEWEFSVDQYIPDIEL
ncbi:MAG: hypothetical protein EOP84_06595 [Verrucomicrobiaceae bacterium]|nr:MAG: hypothetical protein EOP84_06595 [Verrucomicrobiaceae bacterium]